MRLAFFEKYSPFPPTHGRASRLNGLAKELAAIGHEVCCLSLGSETHAALADGVESYVVKGSQNPFHASTTGAGQLRRTFAALDAEKRFDAVQIENPQLILVAKWLQRRERSFIFDAHVIERDYWPTISGVGKIAEPLFRAAEHWLANHASTTLALSSQDAMTLRRYYPAARISVLPHCLDERWFSPVKQVGNDCLSCLFVGSYSHPANQQSARFLADEVAPRLEHAMPSAAICLAGKGMPAHLARSNVRIVPNFPDAVEMTDSAAVSVAPVFIGTGVRTKLIESMARGKAIVANRIAVEGLQAEPGKDYVLAETAAEFAAEIAALLADAESRTSLSTRARSYAERDHRWRAQHATLTKLYGAG